MANRQRDTLFSNPLNQLADFEFNSDVVGVFEDMINRSVPGYGSIIRHLPYFAEIFTTTNSHCYDLGCSLGASTIAMLQGITSKNVSIIAMDNSSEMIRRANDYISKVDKHQQINLKQSDVLTESFENSSLVTLNFLLQFIPPEHRFDLLSTIYKGMNKGGCLILSEKVRFDDEMSQSQITALHHRFKKEQGYSELEIAQKRDSLEKIMKLDSQDIHTQRLYDIGFKHVQQWFQNTAFVSFYAIK